jgi:hypothetical protein
VVDVHETPATPPFDGKGDARIGFYVAGATLIVLGWGFGVILNVLLHWAARTGSYQIWTVHFGYTIGPFSWAVFALGLVTGIIGPRSLPKRRTWRRGRSCYRARITERGRTRRARG